MSTTRTMRVNRWGNSLGIRFPREFVDSIQLNEKSLVNIKVEDDKLIITKLQEDVPRKTLRELFEMYPADYIEDKETEWGGPVGGEIW